VDDRVSDTDVVDDDVVDDNVEGVKATAAEPALVEDSAADAYSWSSSSWSSPSWNSSSSWDPSPTVADTPVPGPGVADSPVDSPAAQSVASSGAGHVPFPADEVGKPKVSTGAGDGAGDGTPPGATQPPRSLFEPAKPSGTEATAVDRIGAAATALNNKLDLNGKLDRGKQAWQSLTGPNSWLSGRGSAGSTDQENAPASPAPASPAPFTSTPSASTSAPSGGAGYSGSGFGSSSWDTPTTRVGQSGSAGSPGYGASGYADPLSRSASYGGPAADATLTAGAAAAGAAVGRAGAVAGAAGYAGAGQSGYGRTGTGPLATSSQSATNRKGSRPAATVKGKRKDQRRQAQLTLSRVEPWSVMKFSFVVSVVAFIVLFVAVALLYMVLSSLGVFESLQHTIANLTSAKNQAGTNVSSWFSASRVLGYTGMLGALNIVLITAMSTIGAVVYNLIAHTIGGIEVTLRETD
jgi:Transmembrane domain of unknown function (DUF3566)